MTRSPRILVAACCTALALAACGTSDPAELVASAKNYLASPIRSPRSSSSRARCRRRPTTPRRASCWPGALDGGDPVNAETEARKALTCAIRRTTSYPLLARAMVLRDQPRMAVNEFGARKLGTPAARADLAASLALAHLRLGDKVAAERLAADAARQAPDDSRVLTQADVASARNDWPAVARFIDQALAKHPGDVVATCARPTCSPRAAGPKMRSSSSTMRSPRIRAWSACVSR